MANVSNPERRFSASLDAGCFARNTQFETEKIDEKSFQTFMAELQIGRYVSYTRDLLNKHSH